MRRIECSKGVTLSLYNTSMFKDVNIAIRFCMKSDRKSIITRIILSQMLNDRCNMFPTKQEVSSHMDELYGASVYTRGYNYGEMHAFEYRFKCVNEHYTQENTFERMFKTAHEFIFNPLMKNDLLDEDLFQEAKKETIMSNSRRLDHPNSKAVSKAVALYSKGYALAETQLFSSEEIEAITLQDATIMWESMILNDQIMMSIVGKIDEEKTMSYVKRFFDFKPREITLNSAYLIKGNEFVEKEETLKIDQTILAMIFETNCNIASDDYWKLRVANALFGQLPTSLLFKEVREKRSLCYSINSRMFAFEGGILVSTGIQKDKIEEVKSCVLEQVNKVVQGKFTDEDLHVAIVMLKNAILGSYDDVSSLVNFEFQNTILNRNDTRDYCIQSIENTTKDDVMRLFKELKHVVTFSLLQEGENEKAH